MRQDIVITGVGIVTGLGVGPEATLEGLRRQRPAFHRLRSFDTRGYGEHRGVEAPDPAEAFPGLDLGGQRRDRAVQHLTGTIDQALRDAGLEHENPVAKERRELILGSTLVAMLSAEQFLREEADVGPARARYRSLGEWPPECALYRLARRFEIGGFSSMVSNACASGAASMQLAIDRLRLGHADLVIAGGFDPMCEYTFAGFGSLLLLSKSGCRPFQNGRDGMLLGEGYGIVVLERADDACARGATPRAYLAGASASSDGFHLTQPDPEGAGATRCIQAALLDAGVTAQEVGYVNLHGTGTPFNDLSEFRALRRVFGEHLEAVPASSTKSYLGHTLGGAGAVEVVISVLALQHGLAPPTLNVSEQDPETHGLDVLAGGARRIDAEVALSNSFGFGGANAAVVVGRV